MNLLFEVKQTYSKVVMKHVGIMELSLTLGESAWLVNPLVGTYFFFLLALVRHAYRYFRLWRLQGSSLVDIGEFR